MAAEPSASFTYTLKVDEFLAKARPRIERGLKAAASLLVTRLRIVVSRPNTGRKRRRMAASRRGKKGSTFTIYPGSSRPGEPPRARTGLGRRSIAFRRIAWNEYIIGVQRLAKHMAFHEFGIRYPTRGPRKGTGFKQIRPWLHSTFRRDRLALAALFRQYARGG